MSEALPVWARNVEDLPALEPDDYARYARHLILEDVGVEGQRRLKGASVLCVGTGGLGSPLLLYLAAAGVGRIGIVDFDVVDQSNLQRQVIHGTATVGKPKLESAKARILDINPHCRVDLYPVALASDNALDIVRPYDVVVDGTDNFPTRYLVNDACVLLDKPNVYGSIFKFEGQASVFNHVDPKTGERGPQYRDLYPEPPPPGLVPSCAEGGVLGILPGVIGCIQATETVKILLGKGTTLAGRLLLYDALGMKFRELKLRRDPNAVEITGLIDYQEFCGVPSIDEGAAPTDHAAADEGFDRIDVSTYAARRDAGWSPFVLDVRKAHELDIARFPGTDLQRPHEDVIAGDIGGIPRDRPVLVTCRSGGRSAKAAAALVAAGWTDVTNLEGGILAWADEIDPSLPKY
ncbi:MAG: molybdopterin-synthase adenylyltransferase MoeB [Alphaproteobacteria bacterium]|nr:molybdopterin-synthase adenylyltransferase MoeB [Alphaproteobacteria bacterium]